MIKGRNKYEKRKKALEMKKLSRKQRKQLKKEKDINNEMKELAATEDYDDRVKTHTEIIQQVFLIYFRILKHKVTRFGSLHVANSIRIEFRPLLKDE